MNTKLDHCWILPKAPFVGILGGRFGDIIQLSGCLHAIWQRTSKKPIMFTSKDYVSVYDGMSFVEVRTMTQGWFDCVMPAKHLADAQFGDSTVVQFWHSPPVNSDTVGFEGRNAIIIQSHGRNWGVDIRLDPDYGTSMARRMGFSRQEWMNLPPVFDRRNLAREDALCKRYILNDRPLLLYNFTGLSSPFGYTPEVMRLLAPYRQHFNMLDLGHVRAERIYDLLGLYDRAVGLITIDTATCHLAPASKVPTIWLTVPGWGKSIPRGNVALHVQYDETPRKLNHIQALLESWKSCTTSTPNTVPPRWTPNVAMLSPA